jgi:hypothetical protein
MKIGEGILIVQAYAKEYHFMVNARQNNPRQIDEFKKVGKPEISFSLQWCSRIYLYFI